MRQILAIVARSDNGSSPQDRSRLLDETLSRARSMFSWTCPVPPQNIAETSWTDGRNTALLAWQNELQDPVGAFSWQRDDAQAWLLGYVERNDNALGLLDSADLLESTSKFSGCFGVVRVAGDRIEAVTDAARTSAIHIVETPTMRMIGTRAIQLHLLAEAERQNTEDPIPRWDLLSMRHMAGGGWVLGDRTPYADVLATPVRSIVTLTPDRLDVRSADVGQQQIEVHDERAWSETVDSVAGALVDAFDPIPFSDLTFGVTGGRDSRMIAAALSNRSDVTVKAVTNGHPDTPDVVIGSQVAKALGFAHAVRSTPGFRAEDDFVTEDLTSRIVRNLDVHDAMTSAWDDCSPYPPFHAKVGISGVGGEIIRGGREVAGADEATPEGALAAITTGMLPGKFFTRAIDAQAMELARPLMELAATDPYRALDDFYFIHHNSRWESSRRGAARMSFGAYDPILDNRVVNLVRTVPAELRWREHLAFDVIARLAPALRDLPIQGSRWRFERLGPSDRSAPEVAAQWEQRYALIGHEVAGRTDWKRLPTPALVSEMDTLILDRLDSSVSAIINRKALVKRITSGRMDARRKWHLATALVAMQVPWYKTTRPQTRLMSGRS